MSREESIIVADITFRGKQTIQVDCNKVLTSGSIVMTVIQFVELLEFSINSFYSISKR